MKKLKNTKTEAIAKAAFLRVKVAVRYWEDASILGIDTKEDGSDVPLKNGDDWDITIDLKSHRVLEWTGVRLRTHFKVCDEGIYSLLDANMETIVDVESYVPDMLCIGEYGCGDYIIMEIDENGIIKDFKCNEALLLDLIEGDFYGSDEN